MTNAIEAIASVLKNFTDEEPKPPLHVGEVMSLWVAYTAFKEARALYQVSLNMTEDPELIHALENALKASQEDVKKVADFMMREGIPQPATSGDKPESNAREVPPGARFTDDDIANLVSVKVAASITFCAQSLSQCIRSDLVILFFDIQVQLMKYSAPLKNLMKKRGWLKEPPAYISSVSESRESQ